MRQAIVAIFILLAASTVASGQTAPQTQWQVELSTDGVAWTSELDISHTSTTRVFARAVVNYVRNQGRASLWYNGGRFQPTVANFDPTLDAPIPLSNLDADGRARHRVFPEIGDPANPTLGRCYVFGQSSLSALDALVPHINQGTLRYAGHTATNPIGTGSGENNVTGVRGVSTLQAITPGYNGSSFVMFTWGIDTLASQRLRTLTFDVPLAGLQLFDFTDPESGRGGSWAILTSPFTTVRAPALATLAARLTVGNRPCLRLPGACIADYDNDEDFDSDDVIAFFAEWEVGDECADADGDSDADSDDVVAFFAAWDGGGC